METIDCPNGHGDMEIVTSERSVSLRGETVRAVVPVPKCPVCGIEVSSLEQLENIQKIIHDTYRRQKGLLTSHDIKQSRKKWGWTQEDLAQKARVGIASVKRWELGQIQSQSMDKLLRDIFNDSATPDVISGNRDFSLERTKLVFDEFEKVFSRKLLRKGDLGLKTTKYLFYADFIAYSELGQSMTGATYACLPLGPQFDNYPELFDLIHDADETLAPPLSPEEKRIIRKIAKRFPTNQSVFDAAHKEPVWKNRKIGEKIPYSHTEPLTQIQE